MAMNPRLLVPRATFDADAAAYLRAVEAADGQALETPVKRAVDDFFKGCKADGIWDAIKASCILCGARTLAGALVPLAGTAPTNNNFVDADYNRETGLVGNATSKYLNSNRANDADPQNDKHLAVYASTVGSGNQFYAASGVSGDTGLYNESGTNFLGRINRNSISTVVSGAGSATGLIAAARTSSGTQQARAGGATVTSSNEPNTYVSENIAIFARIASGTGVNYSNARLAFYSIGESLDLALLDTRVTALVTAIGAAL
jgi:hypothetical protein